jgi:Leucine-rich repeat (LRR) protein
MSLTMCDLFAAAITWLGEELQHVQHLQTLHLDACDLRAVPAQITSMTGLTQLNISSNHIEELPAWLPPSLQWLDAADCNLGEVPAAAESWTDLTRLDLDRQEGDFRVMRPLLPLLSSCPGLKVLNMGGRRWSQESLARILELLQHLEAEGRELEFCYMTDTDRRLAIGEYT